MKYLLFERLKEDNMQYWYVESVGSWVGFNGGGILGLMWDQKRNCFYTYHLVVLKCFCLFKTPVVQFASCSRLTGMRVWASKTKHDEWLSFGWFWGWLWIKIVTFSIAKFKFLIKFNIKQNRQKLLPQVYKETWIPIDLRGKNFRIVPLFFSWSSTK